MNLPISEAFFVAILDQLKSITQDHGYFTDAGARAERGRRTWEASDVSALSLFDGGEQATQNGGSDSYSVTRTFSVHAFAAADQEDTGSKLTLAESDVKRCLLGWSSSGGIRDALGAKATALVYVGSEPTERAEGSPVEGSVLTFTASYREKYGDPTTPT